KMAQKNFAFRLCLCTGDFALFILLGMKMRTPLRVGFTLGAVATLLGIVLICAPRRQAEPLHKGKKISFWISGIRSASRERDSFVNATLDIGPPAVPYLVKAIRAQNSTVRRSRWYAN